MAITLPSNSDIYPILSAGAFTATGRGQLLSRILWSPSQPLERTGFTGRSRAALGARGET
jgi:hypothetical protein